MSLPSPRLPLRHPACWLWVLLLGWVPTPGGNKVSRRPDVLYKTPDGTTKGLNVGKTKADGSPVTREQEATDDLNGAGVETDFIPYDR